jgi:ubiquinone/menaquinone biosynthesis C-methylase UbiE
MNRQDYEYRGLIALSWDLLRGDTSDWSDRSFYRKIILNGGEPALDVGCGTGRLLLDYLSEGLDVDGVEVSPEMLKLCMEKAKALGLNPTIYQQGVESLDVPRKYRTIFIPSSTFQLLTDLTDAEMALKKCYQHLQFGGRLVMSIMDVSQDTGKDWQLVAEKERPQDGLIVRRWLKSTYDHEAQLEHTQDRYELIKNGDIIETEYYTRSPATRNYSLEEIVALMKFIGFQDIKAVSEFSERAASPADTMFCVFGARI